MVCVVLSLHREKSFKNEHEEKEYLLSTLGTKRMYEELQKQKKNL